MILLNFKLYEESFGDKAIELAKICKKLSLESKIRIIPVVSPLDAVRIKKEVGVDVWLQNIDCDAKGAKTGKISSAQAMINGIDGSIVNHSECRKKPGDIKKILAEIPDSFETAVCVQTINQMEKWGKNLKTKIVAYEPSYLIGNIDKSVATEVPEVISKIAKMIPDKILLVGAGVKDKKDVRVSLKMGAKGIILSSSVVKSANPEASLRELIEGFLMV